jgi:hypothetical protein
VAETDGYAVMLFVCIHITTMLEKEKSLDGFTVRRSVFLSISSLMNLEKSDWMTSLCLNSMYSI